MKLDVPASAWGRIIGQGGETLKGLQEQFGVRILVPRPDAAADAMVTLQGPPAACEECAQRIRAIVAEMGRGKAKPTANKKPGKPQPGPRTSAWPATCALCESKIQSLNNAFEHLGSVRHFDQLISRAGADVPLGKPPGQGNFAAVVELLQNSRDLHTQLGFDVDALMDAAPALERVLLARKVLQDRIARLPAIFDWIQVERRWFSAWDASPPASGRASSILEAPPFDELSARCIPDEKPPLIREPGLPAPLPKASPKGRKDRVLKAKHLFPYEPSSRLGIAVLHQHGCALDQFDLVCGTSLIKALSGDSQRCADTYFLQKLGGALCCLHVTTSFHGQDDPGHAAERLFCGSDSKRPWSFFASSGVRIGARRVLITSEVDARDAKGDLVEIKTSGSKRGAALLSGSTALQIACNGSQQVLCCALDKDKTQVVQAERIPAADVLERHRSSFVGDGQRVSLLLERLCGHEYFAGGAHSADERGPAIQLTFDEAKAPVLQPAPEHAAVLPASLPLM